MLNYADPMGWDAVEPIKFSRKNGSLVFRDHKLRILAPDLKDGSAIKAENGAQLSFSGAALEIYTDDAQSTLRATKSGASISLDVNNVWIESLVSVNPSGLLRAQNGSLNLNSDNFVAFFKGKVAVLDAPNNVGSIAAVMNGGRHWRAIFFRNGCIR